MIKRAVSEGPEIPRWGSILLVTTFIIFILSVGAVEYTLKQVIATLAMVETPSAAITVSPSEEQGPKDVKDGLVESGPSITLVHQKPITSSIRGTIHHIVSIAGRFARWRGLLSFVLYSLSFSVVSGILKVIIPRFIPGRLIIVGAITAASLANLHAAWTHKVVSMPSETRFFQRIPSRTYWKQLALPAAVEATAAYITVYIICGFAMLFRVSGQNPHSPSDYSGLQWTFLIFRIVSLFIIALACTLFLILPAHVTLIRVEASILPDDQNTIVPFDRTFGDKVVPRILGGTGCVGFVDAWRSFNWEARRRLLKLYVKVFLIITALFIILAHVLAFEVWAIMGPAVGKFMAQAKQNGILS
ncbi:hypothetical protein CC78DRAFT_467481 [Lojkania enalia]|uniref:Ubiquitin conjugating enzyme n=1 Tax=Lojkania enalia TaxID=147567 RepID=A0A9P4KAZ5_9PLEO|nr:hypothetical protein CC78DRAFT_467481 [Didymosphaeria enalia]